MNTRRNNNLTNQSFDQVINPATSSPANSSVVPTPVMCKRDPYKGNINEWKKDK